jgi:hypothetical protein
MKINYYEQVNHVSSNSDVQNTTVKPAYRDILWTGDLTKTIEIFFDLSLHLKGKSDP